jgi:hypothetical protein
MKKSKKSSKNANQNRQHSDNYYNFEVSRTPRIFVTEEKEEQDLAGPFASIMMILKAMLGLGIFVLPHTCKFLGYGGYAFFYPLVSTLKTLYICLIMKVCDDVGYTGSR